jgi:nucleoid-associated protein YejK
MDASSNTCIRHRVAPTRGRYRNEEGVSAREALVRYGKSVGKISTVIRITELSKSMREIKCEKLEWITNGSYQLWQHFPNLR